MTFDENTRFRRSSSVVSRTIGSELLVVPIRGGVGDLDAIFSFNGLGTDVWALIENELTIEELTAWVVDHYEASSAQVEKDLGEFLKELVHAGLATAVPAQLAGPELGHLKYASC